MIGYAPATNLPATRATAAGPGAVVSAGDAVWLGVCAGHLLSLPVLRVAPRPPSRRDQDAGRRGDEADGRRARGAPPVQRASTQDAHPIARIVLGRAAARRQVDWVVLVHLP